MEYIFHAGFLFLVFRFNLIYNGLLRVIHYTYIYIYLIIYYEMKYEQLKL